MLKQILFFLFLSASLTFFSQVVEEKIQLDTAVQTIKVIYKPIEQSTYYYKKVAVFANDTSQIAIEKSFTSYGQNGSYKVYYPSGQLKVKTVFANNNINGEFTWYNPEGMILIKGIYKAGIKHGFWAYKSLKIYGRYKKGKRNGKWYYQNRNEKKIKSFYKNGVLIKGKGFGEENTVPNMINSTDNEQNTITQNNNSKISKEYNQAISFLTKNIVFRKALKEHFGKGNLKEIRTLKKHYVKNQFQFTVAPALTSLDMTTFMQESKENKIIVTAIDSILKEENLNWYNSISKSATFKYVEALYESSSNKESTMTVYFSDIENNLLRIDVLNLDQKLNLDKFGKEYLKVTKDQKFQILLYFNNSGELKGAEYEKPNN